MLPASVCAGILLARRHASAAAIIAAGAGLFAAGICWWYLGVHEQPAYLPHVLGGLLLTGTGTGFTMPALFGAATAVLPPNRFATGSGLANMVRQVGIALGVAVLVAVLGTGTSGSVSIQSLDRGWIVIAAITIAVPLPALVLSRRRPQKTEMKEREWQTQR